MAAMKILTGTGLFLAMCALGLLAMAICTDYWYETDARRHRERCKNYANKRTDPGYIYISNHNLPLQMPPKSLERKGNGPVAGALIRGKRHFLAAASGMESHCSRQFNSTVSGLWRKCHREGFDLETEDLIYKGKRGGGAAGRGAPRPARTSSMTSTCTRTGPQPFGAARASVCVFLNILIALVCLH